jgi:prepilin-type N-terminal cleavage/methylation domain-containing protein
MQTPMRRNANRSSGFTLIEVVIAMAIFIGGAVAIVRIFPPGLAAIQGSGNRAVGAREANNVLARWNTQANTTPDAIYNVNETTGNYDSTFEGSVVGTANRNKSMPRLVNDITGTALDHFKHIDGEKQKVYSDGTGLYIFTNFPYVAGSTRVFVEDSVEGVRIGNVPDSTNTIRDNCLDFSNAQLSGLYVRDLARKPLNGQFADRPNGAWRTYGLSFPVNDRYETLYYVSYQWFEGGRLNGVVDEPLSIPAENAFDNGLSNRLLRAFGTGVNVVHGSVPVRVVREIGPGAPFDSANDPFVGYLAIPTVIDADASVQAGDTVTVSYNVPDWRWMTMDAPLTTTDPRPASNTNFIPAKVKLPTRDFSDENPDASAYALVYSAPTRNGLAAIGARGSFVVPAGGTGGGAGIIRGTLDDRRNASDPLVSQELNRGATNTILLGDNAAANPFPTVAPRARIAWRALDGWARQPSVAARTYMKYVPGTFPTGSGYVAQPWREFSWRIDQDPNIIYFHPSEAGKTIQVTFEYTTDGGTNYAIARDVIVSISDETIAAADVAGSLLTGFEPSLPTPRVAQVAKAELITPDGLVMDGAGGNLRPTAILSVRGLSVQARTLWADGDRYQQTLASDYRTARRN